MSDNKTTLGKSFIWKKRWSDATVRLSHHQFGLLVRHVELFVQGGEVIDSGDVEVDTALEFIIFDLLDNDLIL